MWCVCPASAGVPRASIDMCAPQQPGYVAIHFAGVSLGRWIYTAPKQRSAAIRVRMSCAFVGHSARAMTLFILGRRCVRR